MVCWSRMTRLLAGSRRREIGSSIDEMKNEVAGPVALKA
ncbi:hypothetical protein CSC31_6500 [Pseudomonas aeruginosa]|nr:hypothetical protein CSC31_6500 [Pseudomonas aeruginosa]